MWLTSASQTHAPGHWGGIVNSSTVCRITSVSGISNCFRPRSHIWAWFSFLPGLLSMALLSSLLGHNQDQDIQERELQTDCSRSHIDWGLPSSWPAPLTGWCPVSFLLVALALLGLAPARLPLGPRLPGSQSGCFLYAHHRGSVTCLPWERVSTFVS